MQPHRSMGGRMRGRVMTPAEQNLRDHQTQLDMDGVMVGVSRQAIDEVLAEIERLRHTLHEIVNLNHHNMGQESRATQIARAALAKDESE